MVDLLGYLGRVGRRLRTRVLGRLRNPHLCMVHAATQLPPTSAPEGYSVAAAVDRSAWAELLGAGGELGAWDEARLQLETALVVPGTQVFLTQAGQPAAAAGVYDRTSDSWEIGWITVHPEHRRRGLGEAVTRLAMDRARSLPPRPLLLYTEDHRLDAIRLYLRLGFVPSLRHRSHRRRWRHIARRLPAAGYALVVSFLQTPDAATRDTDHT